MARIKLTEPNKATKQTLTLIQTNKSCEIAIQTYSNRLYGKFSLLNRL